MLFSFCSAAPTAIKKKNNPEIHFLKILDQKLVFLFQIADDLIDLKVILRKLEKKQEKIKKRQNQHFILLTGYDIHLSIVR